MRKQKKEKGCALCVYECECVCDAEKIEKERKQVCVWGERGKTRDKETCDGPGVCGEVVRLQGRDGRRGRAVGGSSG